MSTPCSAQTASPGPTKIRKNAYGAGKSTTAGMLTTTVRPTSGRAWVAGVDVAAAPAAFGALLARDLTVLRRQPADFITRTFTRRVIS